MTEKIRVINWDHEVVDADVVECHDGHWGFDDGQKQASIGVTREEAEHNVTFLIDQALCCSSDNLIDTAIACSGIFMPKEFDWSFIRDAERPEKMTMAQCFLANKKVRDGIRNTFAHTIALNLGIWPIERDR